MWNECISLHGHNQPNDYREQSKLLNKQLWMLQPAPYCEKKAILVFQKWVIQYYSKWIIYNFISMWLIQNYPCCHIP